MLSRVTASINQLSIVLRHVHAVSRVFAPQGSVLSLEHIEIELMIHAAHSNNTWVLARLIGCVCPIIDAKAIIVTKGI